MLCNVAEALRDLHRDAEAIEAVRRAMELPPDHSRAFHSLWLAADACREGRSDRARELLEAAKGVKLEEYYQVLHMMVEGVSLGLRHRGGQGVRLFARCESGSRRSPPARNSAAAPLCGDSTGTR